MSAETAAVLREAKKRVARKGWDDSPYWAIADHLESRDPRREAAIRALSVLLPYGSHLASYWKAYGRLATLDLFDRAIAAEEAGE